MHHYPLAKGDPLCPLGFHPQVRWPTRCKRCFRDYKEHGGRKKEDDFTASTPALSSWNSPASRGRDEENGAAKERTGRSWSSSQNLSSQDAKKDKPDGVSSVAGFSRSSAAWTSSPDLNEVATAVTVSLKLPKRRQTAPLAPLDTGQSTAPEPATVTLRRPSASPPPAPAHLTINKNDSLAERVRKMQLLKAQNSFEKEASQEKERQTQDRRSTSRSREDEKTSKIKEEEKAHRIREEKKDDVNFLIQVKHARNSAGSKPPVRGGPSKEKDGELSDDDLSTNGTTTTENTLVDSNIKEYQEQVESLKEEVDILRKRCERVEKEKSDILLRRLANLDTGKTGRSSEVLKLQQKVNELNSQNEDLRDEKKSLSLRIKEIEAELESRPNVERQVEQLRAKLLAAETLCEELMDENEDMKKELRDLEEEIEEMQDNFREDQADEYSSLRRELEQSIKNCRVLSFKLKKSERRADQLEQEKAEQEKKLLELAGGQSGLDRLARIKELEQELSRSNEVALRLQRELQEATSKVNQPAATNQRRNPTLAVIGKTSSGEGKVSRASLTRGGSQEDPQQLLRDLQDSLEREADLREQLKNAEEEANNLRKTASRVEDDNESLVLQLKKMATKARTRKLSPTPPSNRLSIENSIDKDEGISDEEDPAELRILLELNEQEAAVLRRKVEGLEQESHSLKRQVKELTEKISLGGSKPASTPLALRKGAKPNLADEKVKVLEEEIAELRKKLIEKERSCERLHAELSLLQSKPKASLNKSKSLDGDQQNVDLKRQLQVIEQEANVLRSKTHTLESDNEKLQAENKKLQLLRGTKSLKSEKSLELSTEKITQLETELKEALTKVKELEAKEKDEKPEKRVSFGGIVSKKDVDALKVKQDELDKMKLNLTKLEKENAKLKLTLKELKEDAIKSFKPRVAKKLTDLTTKLQMKRMVEDLESEIGEMFVIMKNAEINMHPVKNNENKKQEKDLEEIRSKLTLTESELTNEKNRLQTEIAKLKDLNVKLEKDKSIYCEKAKKFEEDKNSALDEKKKLEVQIEKLNLDLKNFSSKQNAMSECMKKIEELKKEMDEKDKEVEKFKKQVEAMKRLEQDKAKLLKETGDKAKKITELENKLKESEDKFKRTEKQLIARKDRVSKLEKEEETLRETSNQKYDEAISSVEMAQVQEKLDNANRELEVKEKQLSSIKAEMSKHATECSKLQTELSAMKLDMEKLLNDKKELDNNVKVQKKEAIYWESKASEFETDLQAERKKVERMRVAHDKDSKNKEVELATLKGKLRTLEQTSGAGAKKISELKQEFEESVKRLEHSLAVERAEYEELTGKYELLEEEHVVTKAKLTIEKEAAQGELLQIQKELNAATSSLRSLQESHTNQTDAWAKERIDNQEQIAKLQERLCGGGWEVEKARMQARLDKCEREARQCTEQRDVTLHQQEALKRELEDARQKLDDYEKVHKVQRNQAAQSAEMEREVATLQGRLEQVERCRRTELADCKMRYDAQMQSMQEELKSLQNQVSRFRRERDTYKQMLEQAQKSMQDMKSGEQPRSKRSSISSVDEEEYRSRLAGLEQQVACLEDELCEARLAASKLKTELVSERSTAEVKLAEMQSRLNEYEEERLLSSGRSRVAGMATRMELAWQKERDEQQRLLQETSTLARDLRQTLFEVERERDKERLDTKRRIEQLKRATEEETDENKKKVTELQCDLLELRDAHAKLRTTNEKLRRDKERHDREREQNKLLVASLKRAQQEDDRKTSFLLETIDDLMKQSPDLFRSAPKPEVKTLMTPTPPRRNRSSKSRSREATPESAGEEGGGGGGVAATLARLQRATDELKASRVVERQRRQANMRRAASTEPRDTLIVTTVTPRTGNGRTPSLKKRSISLEQTTKEQGVIWKVEDGSVSSMQSLDGDADGRLFTMQRDTSLDSRLSGGSTQSDVLPAGEKKKKRGIFGKLKQLTKSRSIDDQPGPDVAEFRPIGAVSQGSDSDMSAAGSRRDIRGRLSDMFHRKGQMSRGNSKDGSRELSTPLPERSPAATDGAGGGGGATSAQRPLARNSSTSNMARADAQRSDASSHSRAASVTPATKRKGK